MLAPYIATICLVGLFIIIVFFLLQLQKKKQVQQRVLGQSITRGAYFSTFTQKSYNILLRVPGIKRLVMNVRKRLETMAVYDEYTLRREVMKIIFALFAVLIVAVTLLIIVQPSWVVAFWVLLGLLFGSGILIDFFVYRVDSRLLKQLKEFNNRTRFFYQQTKIVVDSIYNSIQFAGPEMRIQAERIHNILTAVDPNKELAKYDEVAPTRFLKVIASLSHLVNEFGDKVTESGSAYLRSLTAINQELNNEILFRSKMSWQLRSLSTISLIPIFFALPIKNWTTTSFPIMNNFYDSRIGFLIEVFVYFIAVVCYLIIRKMRQISESNYMMHVKRNQWENKLFEKIPFLHRIVTLFSPKPYTKAYFKLKRLIKDANDPHTVDEITLHRFLIGIGVTILLSSGFIYAHVREEHSILNSNVSISSMLIGSQTEEELIEVQKLTDFDKEIILKIQNSETNVTDESLKKYIAAQMNLEATDDEVLIAYDRIVEKWEVVKNSYFKWWEFLIVLFIAFLTTLTPILNLHYKRNLRFKEMETEVHQLLILISSLREFENMNVYIILSWIERFTLVFKKPVQICLHDYDSGPEEALDHLMENVNFEPFQQLIERLRLALVKISIEEAFDDIDTEREFYLEQRKESQERTIEDKSALGNFIGVVPFACLVILYLVVPIIYVSLTENTKMMQYIQ